MDGFCLILHTSWWQHVKFSEKWFGMYVLAALADQHGICTCLMCRKKTIERVITDFRVKVQRLLEAQHSLLSSSEDPWVLQVCCVML